MGMFELLSVRRWPVSVGGGGIQCGALAVVVSNGEILFIDGGDNDCRLIDK